jgi:hypothetical protein
VFWAGGKLREGEEANAMIGRKGQVSDTIILSIHSTSLSYLSEAANRHLIMNSTRALKLDDKGTGEQAAKCSPKVSSFSCD